MHFYEVLLNQKIPTEVLTYKSEVEIGKGTLVKVPLRNKICFGVVLQQLDSNNFDTEKTKSLSEVLPYIFSSTQLKLIKIVAQNTFNSINTVLDAFLQPLKLLTKKDWLVLNDQFTQNQNILKTNQINTNQSKTEIVDENPLDKAFLGKPGFFIEKDILVRIIYIIRSQINIINDKHLFNKEILVLFPEKKLLDKILSQLKQNPEFNELINHGTEDQVRSDNNYNLQILNYSGDVSAKSKSCVKELVLTDNLEPNHGLSSSRMRGSIETSNQTGFPIKPGMTDTSNQTTIKIIFGTRSSLFLPFTNLQQIIVVDEANTFYIQEQNSLYYDARDLAFLASSTLGAKLDFVSTLPSSRLHNFYSKEFLEVSLYTSKENTQKPLKLQFSQRNSKNDHFSLFSDRVELAITNADTNIGYFESPEE